MIDENLKGRLLYDEIAPMPSMLPVHIYTIIMRTYLGAVFPSFSLKSRTTNHLSIPRLRCTQAAHIMNA